jgi:hypothetical protein
MALNYTNKKVAVLKLNKTLPNPRANWLDAGIDMRADPLPEQLDEAQHLEVPSASHHERQGQQAAAKAALHAAFPWDDGYCVVLRVPAVTKSSVWLAWKVQAHVDFPRQAIIVLGLLARICNPRELLLNVCNRWEWIGQ